MGPLLLLALIIGGIFFIYILIRNDLIGKKNRLFWDFGVNSISNYK
ncbi:hypothetical protein OOK60_03300 [Trichothermofontia sichuanensis B231]|nr:hypothetical protein [Trichothermofontia sichuanensis]UZQ55116.1 hypothetical protein OOK60_03300 [Trichothermofontia sichuanensis B231]